MTHFLLYGTHEPEPQPVRLRAGRLAADLLHGNLRTITWNGAEVLRAISYLVRDRDWGTCAPEISDLVVDQSDEAFSVSYRARFTAPDGADLAVHASISASPDGSLDFSAQARSQSGFETNRCGFCILHPVAGVAGKPVTVEHADGSRISTHFPDLIEPWQPFKDIRAITHTVLPGVSLECRMEGDVFEMEDQRNWSDASYKTYVRPLALPWPYMIPAGETATQRILLDIDDSRSPALFQKNDTAAATVITMGAKHGIMPQTGLVITPEEADISAGARALLAGIAPQELLFHFDPAAQHDTTAFRRFAAMAAIHSGTSTLEIALPCKRNFSTELQEIAADMQSADFRPRSVVISPSVDRQSTPPGSWWPDCPPLEDIYAAAKQAFPGIILGGGMLSYFTELNRKRVPSGPLSFITHCTSPIVHAADDLSVMQTLEALPFITRSVRAIYGDKPYRIGPSTIAMRQNPYGSRTMDNPGGQRITMANRDPRHNGLFACAFVFGYVARVLDAKPECLTFAALTGPFGLIAGKDEPVAEGGQRPIAGAIKALASLAGNVWQECTSSNPARVLAFVTGAQENRQLWTINMTGTEQKADITSLHARTGVLTLSPYEVTSLSLAG